LRLVQRSVAKDEPEPKAISCFGLYLPEIGEMWVRFVDGRLLSSITAQFLGWCCENDRASSELGQSTLTRQMGHLAQAPETIHPYHVLGAGSQPPEQHEARGGQR